MKTKTKFLAPIFITFATAAILLTGCKHGPDYDASQNDQSTSSETETHETDQNTQEANSDTDTGNNGSRSPSQEDKQSTRLSKNNLFIVNSEVDETDTNPGDGKCLSSSGYCTLRAAIQESNADSTQGNYVTNTRTVSTILLPEGHFKFTLAPTRESGMVVGNSSSGVLSISGDTNIIGAGAGKTIIDGNNLDRVFFVWLSIVVSISDVTITGGSAGGIWSDGYLTLTRVSVENNTASYGGGVFSTPLGYVVVQDSAIINNTATTEAGGIRIDSGGLIVNSTISGNKILDSCCNDSTNDGGTAGEGGGIDIRGGGPVALVNSTVANNYAVIGGGGINIAHAYKGDPANVLESLSFESGGPLEIVNSIVSQNVSARGSKNCKNTASTIISLGGNVSDDDSCELIAKNDSPNTPTNLLELSRNGGSTLNHALAPSSPAVTNGIKEACPAFDQRGNSRPSSWECDSGAYQYN